MSSASSLLPINRTILSSSSTSLLLHPHRIFPSTRKLPSISHPLLHHHHHHSTTLSSFSYSSSSAQSASPSDPYDTPLDEIRAAVADCLLELGLSQSDAEEIVLKSPGFIKIAVDGVSELDELALWGELGGTLVGTTSFREKVSRILKEKGEDGKVAFLESFGLSLSSSMNVSRYLPSETLPNLILKVKSMKEIFAPDHDDDHVIEFQVAAKRGGLDMLGSKDASFRHLIESFPLLLLLSLEEHIKPMWIKSLVQSDIHGLCREAFKKTMETFCIYLKLTG